MKILLVHTYIRCVGESETKRRRENVSFFFEFVSEKWFDSLQVVSPSTCSFWLGARRGVALWGVRGNFHLEAWQHQDCGAVFPSIFGLFEEHVCTVV